jgi:hypothetical protein
MTRFDELKAKQEKKQITIDDALELLELYKKENESLSKKLASRERAIIQGIRPVDLPFPWGHWLEAFGVGYFTKEIADSLR